MNKTDSIEDIALALHTQSSDSSSAVVPVHFEFNEGKCFTEWVCLNGVSTPEGGFAAEKAFHEEPLTSQELWDSLGGGAVTISGENYKWNAVSTESFVVDFNEHLDSGKFIYTYAIAVIDSAEARDAILEVGFDGSAKLWLNGELVHENWKSRGVSEDQDLVPVSLNQGSNQLIAKIAASRTKWRFSVRLLSVKNANLKFADAMESMSLEALDKLLAQGLDIDSKNRQGLTALQKARLAGLTVRPAQLIKRGADSSIKLPSPQAFITAFFERGVYPESAGLAYLVAKDGKVISKGGLGMADVENNIPITTQTKFRIGSVTKQFTAVAILLLQERGFLSVDDSLSKYIPDFPKGEKITLRQLLNHTSGIHSYTSMPDFLEKVSSFVEPHDLIEEIKGYDYDFDPGTECKNSDSGFFILGYLVEIISVQSLADFWRENLFTSLGMKDTGAYVNDNEYENEALGYSKIGGKVKLAADWDMSWMRGTGNIYSTVEDLFLWNEAFHNGKVISEKSYRDATTPALLSNREKTDSHFGFGLWLGRISRSRRTVEDRQTISCEGRLPGFLTKLVRLPNKNLTFVTLSNSSPSNLNFRRDPFTQIRSFMMGFDPMEEILDSSEESLDIPLQDYVGDYDHGYGMIHTVTHEDGRLFLQFKGCMVKQEFLHVSGDTFYHPRNSNEIVFERDKSGKVTGLTHIKIIKIYTKRKIEPIEIAEVDPVAFERLVGDYKLNAELIISISTKEGKLFAQATGQNSVELFPVSEIEYKAKIVDIRMVFNPGDDGSIKSLTLHRSPDKMIAPKL